MAPSKEEELPLDIVYSKLIDWLIERKKLSHSWPETVRNTREQLHAAITALPDVPEITDMLKGKQLNYYQCKRILQLLEASEQGQGRVKNFFGQYTNKFLREWAQLLKGYEKENAYLGEASRILIQNATYTCPSIKKSIAQYEKQIQDCNRRVVEYNKTIAEFERIFTESCKELKIDGKDFRSELMALTDELPSMFEALEKDLQSDTIGQAIEYHAAVFEYLHSHRKEEERSPEEATQAFFRTLKRIRAGEKIARRDGGAFNGGSADVMAGEDAHEGGGVNLDIDWDAPVGGATDGGGGEGAADIDWDAPAGDAPAAEAGDISWGDDGGASGAAGGPEGGISWEDGGADQEGVAIDWDAQAAAVEAAAGSAAEWGIEVEEAGAGEGAEEDVPLCLEGDSLLSDNRVRSELVDDLLEFESFLLQRKQELGDEEISTAFVDVYQGAHATLQQQSVSSVDRYLDSVQKVLSQLRGAKLQRLVMIKTSGAYLDRLVNNFRQKLDHIAKLKQAIKDTERRREETQAALTKAVPEYKATAAATKALKAQVEVSISSLFKGRKINIIGDINTL